MANYIETARSNYFKVKDLNKFKEATEHFGSFTIVDGKDGTIAILGDEDFPAAAYDDNGNEMEKNFSDIVAEHLTDDSVFIAMGSGYEKMRYIAGWAYAVDNSGRHIFINLDDIYTKAKEKFAGKKVTSATY